MRPRFPLFVFASAVIALGTAVSPAPAGVLEHVVEDGVGTSPGAAAWPRFTLFGWLSPPLWQTCPPRYAELAGAGFNVTLPAWADTGAVADNRARLDATRGLGVRNLILDNELDSVTTTVPSSLERADRIVARYRDDPAFLGWYLGDEPPVAMFPRLGEWFQILRERDPRHPAWNNLAPRNGFATVADFRRYLDQYCAATHPAVLCNSLYDFGRGGDGHQLVENVATLSAVAREQGIPFWGVLQLTEHGGFRPVTEGMLRWQVAQWLAWGTRGIGYFTYWTPGPDPFYQWQPAMIDWFTGVRTTHYDNVRQVNAHLAPIGNALAGMTWRAAQYAGSVPPGGSAFVPDTVLAEIVGRATLGRFVDSTGVSCALVGNADSLNAQTLLVRPAGGRRPLRLREDGTGWDVLRLRVDGRAAIALGPGDFALLRLEPATAVPTAGVDGPGAQFVARLELSPNPAFGSVRLLVSGTAAAARVTVVDLAGRVAWSRDLAPDAAGATWDGVRDDGGRAGAGVYFARLETPAGAIVRRLAWLGPR